MLNLIAKLTTILLALSIVACGGGGSSTGDAVVTTLAPGEWRADNSVIPATGNFIRLESSSVYEYIGLGIVKTYTSADSQLNAVSLSGGIRIIVNNGFDQFQGFDNWVGEFVMPNQLSKLQVGLYKDAQRANFQNIAAPGLDWGGNGRGCNSLRPGSWIAIDSISYAYGIVKKIELRFEQLCANSTGSLKGQIKWASPDTEAPLDANGYWQANPVHIPATGNYLHLSSQPGDSVGGNHIGTGAIFNFGSSDFSVSNIDKYIAIQMQVNGIYSDGWLVRPSTITQFEVGAYNNISRYGMEDPTLGGMDWSIEGRGCNAGSGWFVIDNISFSNADIIALDVRFEYHCDYFPDSPQNPPALRGQIHWRAP